MKKLLFVLPGVLLSAVLPSAAKTYEVKSPDKAYTLSVTVGEGPTTYSVDYKGKKIIENSVIGIVEANGNQIGDGKVTSSERDSNRGVINVPVGKNSTLTDNYNELTLGYDGGDYKLTLRAYDEGVAYRWTLNYPREITVANELFDVDFGKGPVKVFYPQCESNTLTEYDRKRQPHQVYQAYRNFERAYIEYDSIAAIPDSIISTTPALFALPGGKIKGARYRSQYL